MSLQRKVKFTERFVISSFIVMRVTRDERRRSFTELNRRFHPVEMVSGLRGINM